MSIANSERFSARFRTDDLPADNRVTLVRDMLLSKPVAFDIGPLSNDSFFADMYVRDLPGLEITAGHITARTKRTKSALQDGNDDLLFAGCLGGRLTIEQRNNDVVVAEGTAQLGWCAEPIVYDTDVQRGICLRVPRSAIAPLIPNVDDLIGQGLPHNQEILHLIDVYMRAFESDIFSAAPGLSRTAVTHVHDLIALAIGAGKDASVLAEDRGMRAARTLAIKDDIVRLTGPRQISAETLAKRHGISPRYIRKLFETEGTTLSEFVLEERLRKAQRLLASPLQLHRSISSIAYEVGFGDLSYFNRCFRRKFGKNPTTFRHDHG